MTTAEGVLVRHDGDKFVRFHSAKDWMLNCKNLPDWCIRCKEKPVEIFNDCGNYCVECWQIETEPYYKI